MLCLYCILSGAKLCFTSVCVFPSEVIKQTKFEIGNSSKTNV